MKVKDILDKIELMDSLVGFKHGNEHCILPEHYVELANDIFDLYKKETVNIPDKVYGSLGCKYSVIEQKLEIIGDNQMKLYKELKQLKNS